MICPHCNGELLENNDVCPICGKMAAEPNVEPVSAAEQISPQEPPQADEKAAESHIELEWDETPSHDVATTDEHTAETAETSPSLVELAAVTELEAPAANVATALLDKNGPATAPTTTEQTETKEDSPKPKKRRVGRAIAITFVSLLLVAAAGLAAIKYFSIPVADYINLPQVVELPPVENVTTPPIGAVIPAFSQVDPKELELAAPDEPIKVPDETGIAPPIIEAEQPAPPPIIPTNYYANLANVSSFYSRALQDESYVYYLPLGEGYSFAATADLMRVPIGGTKPEYVPNCNGGSASIYSFTLLERDIIICQRKTETSMYAFYRVPKSGENAQFLFEQDTPAFINVHDGKLFMLFASTQKLGIFDPDVDAQPAFIDLRIEQQDSTAQYLPAFSVTDGYFYCGISYNGGERVEYVRRSLYTSESVTVFSSSSLNELWPTNPIWDEHGNTYYSQFNPYSRQYNVKSCKLGGAPESHFTFTSSDGIFPLLALVDDASFVGLASPDSLAKYKPNSFELDKQVTLQSKPYAITKDYLVAPNGLYKITDLSWLPLDTPDSP